MKPNFLITGSPKSGTTSLCRLLSKHPDIFIPPRKEVHFFNKYFEKGFEWYESHFKSASGFKFIGEGTPDYTIGTKTSLIAKRVASYIPNAKLIYIVRHPIKRIESAYVQRIASGSKFKSLEDALVNDTSAGSILNTSMYWSRINDYRKYFSDDNILVLFFEDFVRDNERAVLRCLEFLGCDDRTMPAENNETRLNSRASVVTDREFTKLIRKSKFFNSLYGLAPLWLTKALKPIFRKPVQASPRWTDALHDYVLEQISSEVSLFLDFYGKDRDFWDLGQRS